MNQAWAGSGAVPSGVSGPPVHVDRSELALESKRDKRRRDMVERVERHRRDTVDRKDVIYGDLQESFSLSLQAMTAATTPNHPEYLLRLHALSVQRDADILAARYESAYAVDTTHQLYAAEVDRVEEEYEAAKKAIKEKLLEACDERARKLREEKDSVELAGLESIFDIGNAKHATRRSRANNDTASMNGGIASVTMTSTHDNASSQGAGPFAGINGNTGLSSADLNDPFNYSLLHASPALHNGQALHPSMLLLQPGSSALLASLKSGSHYHSHRIAGGRAKAGYPPTGLIVTPGSYQPMKSITALNMLRAEEIADDVDTIARATRQRQRVGRRRE